jgi:tetratricopeptide (TPR) repeat protein
LLATALPPADGSRQLPDAWANWLETEVGSGAAQLLIALSVFREPADHNAIVFQLGHHDPIAALAPDRHGPVPPYLAPPGLLWLLAACREARVLTVTGAASDRHWHVSPALADGLHRRLLAMGQHAELAAAHRRAAEYWQWHAASWPQDRRDDVHDLLEARHHMFSAGETEQASEITRIVCAQLRAWGDFEQTAELVQDTLDALPDGSGAWADWTRALGSVYSEAGQSARAQRCFSESVRMSAALGDHARVALGQRSLGALAEAAGEYRAAERHYRRADAAERKAAAAGRKASTEGRSTEDRKASAADHKASTTEDRKASAEGRGAATAARWHEALRSVHRAARAGLT